MVIYFLYYSSFSSKEPKENEFFFIKKPRCRSSAARPVLKEVCYAYGALLVYRVNTVITISRVGRQLSGTVGTIDVIYLVFIN